MASPVASHSSAFYLYAMDLLEKFKLNWKKQFPQLHPANSKLLLAVSGGVDSIVLTHLINKCGFDFLIAHCNFQLRGEESERDEIFVRSLKEKYGKEVLVKNFDTEKYAAENKLSIQQAARELRYNWFNEILANYNPSATNRLLTAHHANDNIETLLINFFRGTGISGLHGISPTQEKMIRPLLFAKREEIESYAKENNLTWVEDSSNALDKYTRNYFRHQLIPSLKNIFPDVEENLLHNIERFKEGEILYQHAIDLYKNKLIEEKGNEFHIPVLKLQKAEPLNSVIWEIIKDFNFSSHQVEEIKKLFDADNGSYVASASYRIIKNRKWLIIAPLVTESPENILIEGEGKRIKFENGELLFEMIVAANHQLSTRNLIATLNAGEIKFPLLLRKWKQGDYFYPLGMRKKKKLSRFFIDLKLSKTEKEKAWVIECNKKILWVIGYRIDERFKITASTKKILRINFEKAGI